MHDSMSSDKHQYHLDQKLIQSKKNIRVDVYI